MKLIIERKRLLETIVRVHSIVEKKNIIPILEHVKIDIADGVISFTTTDLDITIRDCFQVDSNADVSFTMPVQPLYEITKKLTSAGTIEFNLDGIEHGRMEISGGNSKIVIPCLHPDEFPSFEKMENAFGFTIPSQDLRKILLKTRHAMASGELRYYLNGINLSTSGGVLTAAATDIHRLAVSEVETADNLTINGGAILPKKTVSELLKLTDHLDDKDMLEFSINESRISLKVQNTILISKLINGKYPNYASIFTIKPDKVFSVDSKSLINAVELVSAIADSKVKIVTIMLDNDRLIIAADNTRDGKSSSAEQELPVDSYFIDENDNMVERNDEVRASFLLNAKYLIDALNTSTGPRVHFRISTSTAPVVIRDVADSSSTYVLMPMQLETNAPA